MAEVIWSPKAADHLDQISQYISMDSAFYAESTVARTINATRRLELFPELGAIIPEFNNPMLREIRVFSYRIIYQLNAAKDEVRIHGVVHGARLLSDIFTDDDFTQ